MTNDVLKSKISDVRKMISDLNKTLPESQRLFIGAMITDNGKCIQRDLQLYTDFMIECDVNRTERIKIVKNRFSNNLGIHKKMKTKRSIKKYS